MLGLHYQILSYLEIAMEPKPTKAEFNSTDPRVPVVGRLYSLKRSTYGLKIGTVIMIAMTIGIFFPEQADGTPGYVDITLRCIGCEDEFAKDIVMVFSSGNWRDFLEET